MYVCMYVCISTKMFKNYEMIFPLKKKKGTTFIKWCIQLRGLSGSFIN